MEKFEACIITKELPEPSGTSRHVGISQENYSKLMDISRETGRSLRWLCNYLLQYALSYTKIED